MLQNGIIGAAICFAAGLAIAYVNYLFSRYILVNKPEKYSLTTVIRQMVQVAFLAAVYFIGEKTEADTVYLLIGAALGVTLPMIFLTKKLLGLNEKISEKGDEADG